MDSASQELTTWLTSRFEEGCGWLFTSQVFEQWPNKNESKAKISLMVTRTFPTVRVSAKRHNGTLARVYLGLVLRQQSSEPSVNLKDVGSLALREGLCVVELSDHEVIIGILESVCGRTLIKRLTVSANGALRLQIGDIPVDLNSLKINENTEMTAGGLKTLFRVIKAVKLCRGYQFTESVQCKNVLCDRWFEDGVLQTSYRSVHCLWAIATTDAASSCSKCQNQRQHIYMQMKCKQNEEKEEMITLNEQDDGSINKIFQQYLPDLKEIPGLETLIQSQVDNIRKEDKRQRRWSPKIIQLCLTLWSRSPKAYADLRESGFLLLPSGSLLSLYKNSVHQSPGFNPQVFEWMHAEFHKTQQPVTGKEGGILLDEMAIQSDLQITSRDGVSTLVGFVDLGEEYDSMKIIERGKSEKTLATHVLQMVFLGDEGFRFPFCHFPTNECEGPVLWRKFWHAVQTLREWSFKVNYVCMDGAVQNRTFMKSHFVHLGSPLENLFTAKNMFRPDENIVFIMDPSNTLKKIRNNLLKSKDQTGAKRILTVGGEKILWNHWIKAWEWDRAQHSMSIYHKLTHNHLFPDSNLKMRNKLAFEVLNKDMLYLMKTYQQNICEEDGKKLTATIKLLEHTSKIVEVFSDMRAITTSDDSRLYDLRQCQSWFEEWEAEVTSLGEHNGLTKTENKKQLMSDQTREDLASSIIGLNQLVQIKEQSGQGGYIVAGRINTDIVENIFCQQRGLHNGAATNPSYLTYCHTINSILIGQTTVSRKNNVGKGSEPFNFHSDQPLRKRRKQSIGIVHDVFNNICVN